MMLIGVASYLNPEKLHRTLQSIGLKSEGEWLCLIVHNDVPGDRANDEAKSIIQQAVNADHRFECIEQPNSGYCGAVNMLIRRAACTDVKQLIYCDNDIEIHTQGWNLKMLQLLTDHPEIGWVFPGEGHYQLHNGRYFECLWHAGYCWMMNMDAREVLTIRELLMFNRDYLPAGLFNTYLGHHEEVDWMIRMRLAGFTTACIPGLEVTHHETHTRGDEAQHKPGGRIHDGVVRWMNFWNGYFCGAGLKYSMTAYDPRALRYTDWPPCALYLERLTLATQPGINQNPREVHIPGVGNMDAIEVLKPSGCYRGRAI